MQRHGSVSATNIGSGTRRSARLHRAGRVLVSAISVSSVATIAVAVMMWIEAPRGADGFPGDPILYAVAILSIAGTLLNLADGVCARFLGVASSFGRFIDLFCDVAANTLPPLIILALLPFELGGQPLPRAILWGVSLLYLAAVLAHYAQVATRQVEERKTRFSRYRSLPVTVVPVFLSGWLLACACDAALPGSGPTVAGMARANTAIVVAVFALGAVLVCVPVRYPRIPDFIRGLYLPWYLVGAVLLLFATELCVAVTVTVYAASPMLERAGLLRASDSGAVAPRKAPEQG